MNHLKGDAFIGKAGTQLLNNGDATMASTGASDRDGKITFSFSLILGQQKTQKILETPQKITTYLLRKKVGGNCSIQTRQRLQLLYKMRIGQKTDIHNQVRL
jgi:hypothetical protein